MKRLARLSLISIAILACSFSSWCNSRCSPPMGLPRFQREDALEIFGAEALNRSDLALADLVIDSQLKKDSSAIQWHFFRGVRSYIEISYEKDRQNEENFRRVQAEMEKVVEIGERRLETNPSDSIALFYIGGACGYLGIAQV